MGVLDWMCLIHDWNFWKAYVDIVISFEVPKGNFLYGIISNIFSRWKCGD